MDAETGLEALLDLDGSSFEIGAGYVVEFTVRQTEITEERPHGLSYALVFRPLSGKPIVRFDNAHAMQRRGGRYVKGAKTYDHWHNPNMTRGAYIPSRAR